MNPEHKIAGLGAAGLLAKITVEQFNHYAGAVIAGVTILALIPLAFTRWAEFLSNKKTTETFKRAGKIAVAVMFALGVLAWLLFVTGCGSLPWNKPSFKAPDVVQIGEAQTPGVVIKNREAWKFPLVPGSTLTLSTAGKPSGEASGIALGADLPAVELTREQSGTVTPTTYAPPAPPTPEEVADGTLKIWLTVAAVFGVAACIFGIVRGWDFVALGGGCIACAAGVGIVAAKIPSWVYILAAVGVTLAGAGWAAWHFKIKPLQK